MKTARLSLIALALATASAGMSFAAADASTPKTRDQVRAELAQALRDGTLIADGQTGATYRDLNPGSYKAQPAPAPGKTRAQVRAELNQAWANGELVVDGQTGATARETDPGLYAATQADSKPLSLAMTTTMTSKTRAQVQAELRQAWMNGDLIADGQTGATYRELNPGQYPMQAAVGTSAPIRVGSAPLATTR